MPNVDSTLGTIVPWKYIIISNLTKAFYQIPLAHKSMKYYGVVTPYHGVRVYACCAMGMPGSETALKEIMCRVLSDLLKAGVVAKIMDDIYCGGDTPEELLVNWGSVLSALQNSILTLSGSKLPLAQSLASSWVGYGVKGYYRQAPPSHCRSQVPTPQKCPWPTLPHGCIQDTSVNDPPMCQYHHTTQ